MVACSRPTALVCPSSVGCQGEQSNNYRKKEGLFRDSRFTRNGLVLVGIPFTTAVAILVRSYQKGLIDRSNALVRLTDLPDTDVTGVPFSKMRSGNWRNSHDQDDEYPNGPGSLRIPQCHQRGRAESSVEGVRTLVTRGRILIQSELLEQESGVNPLQLSMVNSSLEQVEIG
jgi:hypothetical protein